MVSIVNVSQRFGTHTVLRQINLEVAEREVVSIMGSSGGGKTTLLRCVSGLTPASDGEVLVDGVSVAKTPEAARRKMGMVFQSAALFDFLSVWDNVSFGLERTQAHISKAELHTRTGEALARVGLQDEGGKMPSELSGGMRKRVGMARALVLEPKVMLYDEPTTGLDPITTYSIDELVVRLKEEHGMTSLLVSHDVSSVVRVSDRIAFLDGGEMVFLGTSAEFLKSEVPAIQEVIHKSQALTLAK